MDVLDQGKLTRRKCRQAEAAAAALDDQLLAVERQRNTGFLGQSTQDVEQLSTRHRNIARRLHGNVRRGDELNLKIRRGDRHTAIAHVQQHVGQHRHRLASLDDTNDRLQRAQQFFPIRQQFHALILRFILRIHSEDID